MASEGYPESDLDKGSVSSVPMVGTIHGLVVKRHDALGVIGGEKYRVEESDYDGLILVIRDPVEAIVRHRGVEGVKSLSRAESYSGDIVSDVKYFADNLSFYHEAKIPKMIVRYEEMIRDTRRVYGELNSFCVRLGTCGTTAIGVDDFMAEIDRHREICLERYGVSQTRGKSTVHHQKKISKLDREELILLIINSSKPECLQYLSCYGKRYRGMNGSGKGESLLRKLFRIKPNP